MKTIALVLIAVVLIATPIAAMAADYLTISAKALETQVYCQTAVPPQWHAVITQVTTDTVPTVTYWSWDNGAKLTVPVILPLTGKTGHYTSTLNMTSTIKSITATVPVSWTGQFNLSCDRPTAVKLSSFTQATSSWWDQLVGVLNALLSNGH